jgi:hypothetical protein
MLRPPRTLSKACWADGQGRWVHEAGIAQPSALHGCSARLEPAGCGSAPERAPPPLPAGALSPLVAALLPASCALVPGLPRAAGPPAEQPLIDLADPVAEAVTATGLSADELAFRDRLAATSLGFLGKLTQHQGCLEAMLDEEMLRRLFWLLHAPTSYGCLSAALALLRALLAQPQVAWVAGQQAGALYLLEVGAAAAGGRWRCAVVGWVHLAARQPECAGAAPSHLSAVSDRCVCVGGGLRLLGRSDSGDGVAALAAELPPPPHTHLAPPGLPCRCCCAPAAAGPGLVARHPARPLRQSSAWRRRASLAGGAGAAAAAAATC